MNAFQGFDSMDERRRRLLQAMQGHGGRQLLGQQKGGSRPIYGGGKRIGAGDMAPMGNPGLAYNPLIAALARGQAGLHGPSHPAAQAGLSIAAGAPGTAPGQQMQNPAQGGQIWDPFAGAEGQGGAFNVTWRDPNYAPGMAQPQPKPLLGQSRLQQNSLLGQFVAI